MAAAAWLLLAVGCDRDQEDAGASAAAPATAEAPDAPSAEELARRRRIEQERLDAEYPKYAAVVGTELSVHDKPDEESTTVGWLRIGARVRLGAQSTRARGCKGGYRPIHPTGFVCTDGLFVRDRPIEIEAPTDEGWKNGQAEAASARGAIVLPPPARDEPLPYDYYFVKELAVPSYHRLPSRNEQRAADAKRARYLELLESDEGRARRYANGELDDGPAGTEVTARYLDHGFFVASNGTELRASRRFVRTLLGRFVKQARLEPRKGSDFHGVELDGANSLPIVWAVRESEPLIASERGEQEPVLKPDAELPAIERLARLDGWRGHKRMGGRVMHEIDSPRGVRYLRSWYAAVAHAIARPPQVPAGEAWVHVDLDQQTIVLYRGDRPVYATLMSSGMEGHETPTGVFRIRRKRVTDTMADLGPEAGDDRYRVEDVPWTQYFEGSFALHAAFWHTRFGTRRSHGCVNLSPIDAHRIFGATQPAVPEGWHGVSAEGTEFQGSFVVVTDDPPGLLRPADEAQAAQSAEEAASAQPDAPEAAAQAPQAEAEERPPPSPRGISASARSIEAWQKRQPEEVKYTIERGGTARFVANLFQIPYREIQALNPDVELDVELRPGTELTIYRHEADEQSLSRGRPERGSIAGAAPMPEGEGRILKATPGKRWATRRTVGLLDAVLRAWPQLEPGADPLLVGTLSLRKGGRLPPHHTHQSGRDVDLGYPQIRVEGEPYNWRDMGPHNLDARRTWRLLHLLQASGELEAVFIDRGLQKLLYEYAVENNLLSEAELRAWLEYPRAPGDGSPIVQHVPGHVDHLHVRFTCGGQPGCE